MRKPEQFDAFPSSEHLMGEKVNSPGIPVRALERYRRIVGDHFTDSGTSDPFGHLNFANGPIKQHRWQTDFTACA